MKIVIPSSRSRCLATAASLAVLLILVTDARADFITLDPPGSISSTGGGVFGSNVDGNYTDARGIQHGFLYNGTGYTTLDPPGSVPTGADPFLGMVGANGMSGSNVGGYYFDGRTYHGFLYNGTGYTTLDPPGSTLSYAADVSGNNVVGAYKDGSGTYHGFLYNGTGYTILDVPGSTSTKALSVSGGNIAGSYTDGSGNTHGFLYNGTGYIPLNPPGSISSIGYGVFSFAPVGTIGALNAVGRYDDSSGRTHGFLYNGTGYVTLDPPGSTTSEAITVSFGNVVGDYTDGSGNTHGLLYNGTGYIPVDPPGSVSPVVVAQISGLNAFDFNVVGTYTDSSGRSHAYLFTGPSR